MFNGTFTNNPSEFSEEDYKRCIELLNFVQFQFPVLKAIIVTNLIPTEQSKQYEIKDDGIYFLFGKHAWEKMLKLISIRPESMTIYSTYMDIPIIESDEKAQEIINKSKESFEEYMARFRVLCQYNLTEGMLSKYFITKGS